MSREEIIKSKKTNLSRSKPTDKPEAVEDKNSLNSSLDDTTTIQATQSEKDINKSNDENSQTDKSLQSDTDNLRRNSSVRRKSSLDKINLKQLLYINKRSLTQSNKHLVVSLNIINIKDKDEEGRNILHRACLQQKFEIVKSISMKILEEKLVNEVDSYGNTALILACKVCRYTHDNQTRLKILECLIDIGADLDQYETVNGWTAIHWLSYNGDEESIKLLMKNGAVYYIPDMNGYFPIDLAGIKGYRKIVEIIIQEFLDLLDAVGEFKILDVKLLNLKNYRKVSSAEGVYQVQDNLDIINEKKAYLDLLNDNSSANSNSNGSKSQSINENNSLEDENKIVTNLELLDPILQTVFIKLMIDHCLYWGSYFKIHSMYVNKLLTIYNAKPHFQIINMKNQTAIHAACACGNSLALKLLLNKYLESEGSENERKFFRKNSKINSLSKVTSINKSTFMRNVYFQDEAFIKNTIKDYKKHIGSDKRFKSFSSQYKKYIMDNLKIIFYPIEKSFLDFSELTDSNLNTPLHLSAINGKWKFIKDLYYSDLLKKNFDLVLKKKNNMNFSGYELIKDKNFIQTLLTKSGKKIYHIPIFILELHNNEGDTKSSINMIVKVAKAEKLEVALIEHKDKDKIYLCIDISNSEFCIKAEKEQIKMKLLDKNLKKTFENTDEFITSVEPFNSRLKQEIISKVISNILDLKLLKDQKILIDILYTHKPNVLHKISNIWLNFKWYCPNPFNLFFKLIFEDKNFIYDEIDLINRYFGEKIAIYYAFVSFYINNIFIVAIAGIVTAFYYKEKIVVSYSIFPTYAIIYLVWTIYILEKWKRKNAEITHKWGLNDTNLTKIQRAEFKGDEYYIDLNGKLEKHYERSKTILLIFSNLPIILGLNIAVIYIFQYTTKIQGSYDSSPYLKYAPGIIKSIAITVISKIYDLLANYFTNLENHKTEEAFENAIIIKLFTFRLIVDLTAVIYVTIIEQNVESLKSLLYSLIAVKMSTEIMVSVVVPYFKFNYFKKKYFEKIVKETKKNKVEEMLLRNPIKIRKLFSGDFIRTFNEHRIKGSLNEDTKKDEIIYEKLNMNIKNNNEGNNFENKEKVTNPSITISNEHDQNNTINKNSNHQSGKEMNHIFTIKHSYSLHEYFRKVRIIHTNQVSSNEFKDKINSDYIEINNMMNIKNDLVLFYADIIIIYTISSLFAIVIPLAPLLILIFTTISFNLKIYADIHIFKRPPAKKSNNIGLWLNIMDVVSTASIMFNGFLFYFYSSNKFNNFTRIINKSILNDDVSEAEFDVGVGETALLIIALAEHFLILFKYFTKYIINDTPSWVLKEREILKTILEDSIKSKEDLHNKAVDSAINQYLGKFKSQLDGLNKKIERKDEQIQKDSELIEKYRNDLIKTSMKLNEETFVNQTLSEKIKRYDQNKDHLNNTIHLNEKIQSLYPKLHLPPLLHPVTKIPLPKMSKDEYDEAVDFKFDKILQRIVKDILRGRKIILEEEMMKMKVNIKKIYIFNFMKNTFDRLEKEILTKKFAKVLSNINSPILLCEICFNYKANYFCYTCEEKLCWNCKEIHNSNNLWVDHNFETFCLQEHTENIYVTQQEIKQVQENSSKNIFRKDLSSKKLPEEDKNERITNKKRNFLEKIKSNSTNIKSNNLNFDQGLYVKLERYCFPTQVNNLNYDSLMTYFNLLYKEYVIDNGISHNNDVDTKKLIEYKVDVNIKSIDNPIPLIQDDFANQILKSNFNYEEQFLINRISFMLFKQLGALLNCYKVFLTLKILQNGTYEERLEILLKILDIYDNKIILKSEFEKFLVFLAVQNYNIHHRINNIIEDIFAKHLMIRYEELYSMCLNKNTYKQLLYELLQI